MVDIYWSAIATKAILSSDKTVKNSNEKTAASLGDEYSK